MKRIFFLTLFCVCRLMTQAQESDATPLPRLKIAVFAPLFLDSVVKENQFIDKNNFPRFVVPGLDFVQGVQICLDSFPLKDAEIETYIYDSKADSLSITNLINTNALDSMELIIGSVKDKELVQLARFSKSKNIPFFSATFPNDGGVTSNPLMILMNPTLKTHCETIFSALLTNDSSKLIYIRKAGSVEDRIAGYFNNINQNGKEKIIDFNTLVIDSNFNLIKPLLDSTHTNVIIGGSMDEKFTEKLVNTLNSYLPKYQFMLIGMPNWESFDVFNKNNTNNNIKLYFTSPYFNEKQDSFSNVLLSAYENIYKGKPTEFAFKGFECMYVFSRILSKYTRDFINHVNDDEFRLFTKFKFMPVRLKTTSFITDYYENKQLYFLTRKSGITWEGW